jgi:hypothetical protein
MRRCLAVEVSTRAVQVYRAVQGSYLLLARRSRSVAIVLYPPRVTQVPNVLPHDNQMKACGDADGQSGVQLVEPGDAYDRLRRDSPRPLSDVGSRAVDGRRVGCGP